MRIRALEFFGQEKFMYAIIVLNVSPLLLPGHLALRDGLVNVVLLRAVQQHGPAATCAFACVVVSAVIFLLPGQLALRDELINVLINQSFKPEGGPAVLRNRLQGQLGAPGPGKGGIAPKLSASIQVGDPGRAELACPAYWPGVALVVQHGRHHRDTLTARRGLRAHGPATRGEELRGWRQAPSERHGEQAVGAFAPHTRGHTTTQRHRPRSPP